MTPHAEARPHTALSRRSCWNDEPITTTRTRPRPRRIDPHVQRGRGAGAADDRGRPDPALAPAGQIAFRCGAARRAGRVDTQAWSPAAAARAAARGRV